MKNHVKQLFRKFLLTASLLSIWSILCGYLVFSLRLDFPVLAIILNLLVILLTLWLPFPYVSWGSVIFSIIQYSSVILIADGFTIQSLISTSIGAALFLGSKLLSTSLKKQINVLLQQLTEGNRLIESMTTHDRNTNLLKWRIAKSFLVREIARSQHYKRQLSLILFDVQKNKQYSKKDLADIRKNLTDVIQDVIRTNIDIPFIGENIGLILPDRDLIFAQEFSKLIILMIQQNLNVPISAGIANFPQNANSTQELVDQATSALRVAVSLGEPFVTYHSHLSEDVPERLKEIPDSSLEFTQQDFLEAKRNLFQDYERILSNIQLEKNEWIIWLRGINRMEDLYASENSIHNMEHVEIIEFLFVQANHLVIKVETSLDNLRGNKGAFQGWKVKKINARTHFLLLHQSEK